MKSGFGERYQWASYYFTAPWQWPVVLASVIMIAIIGTADHFAGPRFSLLLFYLIPILHASWFAGRAAGFLVSLMCSCAWLISRDLYPPGLLDPSGAILNVSVRLGIFLLITYLVTWQVSLIKALAIEKQRSSTDPFTGVLNEREFSNQVGKEYKRSKRYAHPFSIAFVDIDNIKNIDDRLNHAPEDRPLRIFVSVIRSSLRATDQIGRLGDNEFAILLPETGEEAALKALIKVKNECFTLLQDQGYDVTATVGLATYKEHQQDIPDFLHKADEAMHEAKRQGKIYIQHTTL